MFNESGLCCLIGYQLKIFSHMLPPKEDVDQVTLVADEAVLILAFLHPLLGSVLHEHEVVFNYPVNLGGVLVMDQVWVANLPCVDLGVCYIILMAESIINL